MTTAHRSMDTSREFHGDPINHQSAVCALVLKTFTQLFEMIKEFLIQKSQSIQYMNFNISTNSIKN